MNYEEAIAAAKAGKRVARQHWCDVFLRAAAPDEDGELVLDHGDRVELWDGPDDGNDAEMGFVGDEFATDWHEVDEDGKRIEPIAPDDGCCATCRPFYGVNGDPAAPVAMAWPFGICPDCKYDGIPF